LIYTYRPSSSFPSTPIEKLACFLIEAALDLAATPPKTFQTVIFPLTRLSIIAGSLLVFCPRPQIVCHQPIDGRRNSPTLGEVIQNQFMQAENWPIGVALGC